MNYDHYVHNSILLTTTKVPWCIIFSINQLESGGLSATHTRWYCLCMSAMTILFVAELKTPKTNSQWHTQQHTTIHNMHQHNHNYNYNYNYNIIWYDNRLSPSLDHNCHCHQGRASYPLLIAHRIMALCSVSLQHERRWWRLPPDQIKIDHDAIAITIIGGCHDVCRHHCCHRHCHCCCHHYCVLSSSSLPLADSDIGQWFTPGSRCTLSYPLWILIG